MPLSIALNGQTDFAGWRGAARRLALNHVPPEEVVWSTGEAADLFAEPEQLPEPTGTFNVPRAFVDLAETAILHSEPERFALLYRLLWRLLKEPNLLAVSVDPDVARIELMAKNVRRDIHKMHAFVRFREVAVEGETRFVAWFEPEHHIIEAGAPFFARRFPNMLWSILSPEVSAHWDSGELTFGPGAGRHEAPSEDAVEDVWRSYYASIFNPARLKVQAMRSEMPQKYWRNLPEAPLIAPLIAEARKRTDEMVAHAVTAPKVNRQREVEPARARRRGSNDPLEKLREQAKDCRMCPLWKPATQTVFGEGPPDAEIVFVGEQPGDKEDLAGKPFVGPAGQLFDQAMAEADLDRATAYITNAVKHFKFTPRGKIRLHQKPNTPEIRACHPWLDKEIEIIRPKFVVAMGATAVQSVFGKAMPIGKNRGHFLELGDARALVTVHPSYLLRVPDADRKAEEYARFVEDLRLVRNALQAA
ncbi:UdgX family uracil-DNA binding protein [Flaviflagellibacter deserti]|uniref:Type-4 uracil-DNA glycosylase n=1 Tax=Flaviflagellibacter deserti TaxID=2267266 RepID=A0ABV9YZ87_9HYPH